MAAQAQHEGRFLGGRPPYGYQLADAGAHPNPGKAADGNASTGSKADPVAAPIVVRIFAEYVAGAGVGAIAEGLNRDGVPSPSGHDPPATATGRGERGLGQVRDPGHPRQSPLHRPPSVEPTRRDEELLDVDDVAAGYKGKMKWNDRSDWVWCNEQTTSRSSRPNCSRPRPNRGRSESTARPSSGPAGSAPTASRR